MITADTALRLSRYFSNSAEFWLGIQAEHDLRDQENALSEELARIPRARTHQLMATLSWFNPERLAAAHRAFADLCDEAEKRMLCEAREHTSSTT